MAYMAQQLQLAVESGTVMYTLYRGKPLRWEETANTCIS